MNRKKSTGIIASAALAVFGMLLLFMFTKGKGDNAEAQAQAAVAPAEPMKNVYVASIDIPKGVTGDSIEASLKKTQVPLSQLVPGADADVDFKIETIRGKLTAQPIPPNQQITNLMFESTEAAASAALPAGKLAVTLIVPGERLAGIGRLPNETVGIVASFAGAEGGSVTHLALHKVQIVGRPVPFGGVVPTTVAGQPDTGAATSYLGQVQVTLAVDAGDAERLIFMNQFGVLHFVAEPLTAEEDGTKLVKMENVYESAGGRSALDDAKSTTTTSTTVAPAEAAAAADVLLPTTLAPTTLAATAAPSTTLVAGGAQAGGLTPTTKK